MQVVVLRVLFHSILPHNSGYGDRGGSSADGNYNYGGKLMVVLSRSFIPSYKSQ